MPARALDIIKYERLPLTPANQTLLTIQAPAGTKVISMTLAQAQANARARDRHQLAAGRRALAKYRREHPRAKRP